MVNGVSGVGITVPEVFILAGVGAEIECMDQVLSIAEVEGIFRISKGDGVIVIVYGLAAVKKPEISIRAFDEIPQRHAFHVMRHGNIAVIQHGRKHIDLPGQFRHDRARRYQARCAHQKRHPQIR